jgi:hypothetical protein
VRALLAVLLLTGALRGCVVYEYEHEIWVDTDGSGRVNVTGRPELWTAFKGVGEPGRPESVTEDAVRQLFERSGLEVRRVRKVHRRGHDYIFVDGRFDDINKLAGTPAFPDLRLSLAAQGADRLSLTGTWVRPPAAGPPPAEAEGLLAVRFHVPSKIYGHKNAFEGVQRGNIVGWRQDVSAGLAGRPLEIGVDMDHRSILWSTVSLFVVAIALGLSILAACLFYVLRKGRRQLAVDGAANG